MGSKPRVEINLDDVQKYAALGLTQEQIAAAIGIGKSTFYRLKSENEEFARVLKIGQAAGVIRMAEYLTKQAEEGNTTAAIFYLKTHGWKESKAVEISGRDGEPIETRTTVVNLTKEQEQLMNKLLDEEY